MVQTRRGGQSPRCSARADTATAAAAVRERDGSLILKYISYLIIYGLLQQQICLASMLCQAADARKYHHLQIVECEIWMALYVAASSICVLYFFFPNKIRVVSKYSGKYQMFGICSPLKASVLFLKHSVSLNIFMSYSYTQKEKSWSGMWGTGI